MRRKTAIFLLGFLFSSNVIAKSSTVHDPVLLKITGSLSYFLSWEDVVFYAKRADVYSQCYGKDKNCPIYINLARNSTVFIDVQSSEFGSSVLYCKFSITSKDDTFSTSMIYSGGGGECNLTGDPNTNLNLEVIA